MSSTKQVSRLSSGTQGSSNAENPQSSQKRCKTANCRYNSLCCGYLRIEYCLSRLQLAIQKFCMISRAQALQIEKSVSLV